VPELVTDEVTLHVEVDGQGEPVIVLAHGLTNSCRELAMLTGFVPGTKVRFCFRGHGHSTSPLAGYRFADFAGDLRAVADAYEATVAVGTSLGAGAISNLVADDPDRFEKLVFLLPAGLDVPFQYKDQLLETAARIEGRDPHEVMEALLADPERVARYVAAPWLRDLDVQMMADLNTEGVPRAIREVIDDWPLRDRQDMAKVTAPTLFICQRGDVIHPAEIGEILVEIMPNAELIMFDDGEELMAAIPSLIARVVEFLGS
jgi:pimeloyl-ACP methyl ester carboxylesterase